MCRSGLMVLLLAFMMTPAAGGETSGRVRIQLGHEYDTNSRRIYYPRDEDNLLRTVLEGLLQHASGKHGFMLNYQGGLKLFYNQTSENQLANKLKGVYRYSASENWQIGGRLTLRDTLLEQHDRDYRLLYGEIYARNRLLPWLDLELIGGGKHFKFKPDEYGDPTLKFSYLGPVAGLRLDLASAKDVSATVLYQAELRFFDDQVKKFIDGRFQDSGEDRFDVRHVAGLRVKQQIRYWDNRRLILEVSYFLSVNDSKSGGSSAIWHRLRMLLSMQLPRDIVLSLMGTLQFTDYPDGIYVEGDLYEPEADENENSLVVRLSFPLVDGLGLVLQGAVYRNDFNSGEFEVGSFKRETVMLGLAYDLDL